MGTRLKLRYPLNQNPQVQGYNAPAEGVALFWSGPVTPPWADQINLDTALIGSGAFVKSLTLRRASIQLTNDSGSLSSGAGSWKIMRLPPMHNIYL